MKDIVRMRLRELFARHSDFITNVGALMSGKAIAGVIAIFTMPIVARLFDPSDFGVAVSFASIISIISSVAALRYETALVVPKEDQDARELIALTYRILLCVSFFMLAIIVAYEISGTTFVALELLGPWKWLLPLGMLLITAITIQEQWLTRRKAFTVQSVSLITGNVVTSGSRIGFGALLGSSAGGLIAGYLIGMALRLATHGRVGAEGLRAGLAPASWPALRDTARRFSDFPKFNAPASLIFTMGQWLPVLLFAGMYSPAVAGFYGMAQQLSHAPVTIVSESTRRVFLQKAASITNRGGSLIKAFLLATGGLALLGIPFLAVVSLFGEPLLTWFLGARWSMAGQYLEIMAPWLFMLWVMAPCNPVFIVLRQQKTWLFLQVLLTTLRLGSFWVAWLLGADPEWTLRTFVIATIAGNLVAIAAAYLLIRRSTISDSDDGRCAG